MGQAVREEAMKKKPKAAHVKWLDSVAKRSESAEFKWILRLTKSSLRIKYDPDSLEPWQVWADATITSELRAPTVRGQSPQSVLIELYAQRSAQAEQAAQDMRTLAAVLIGASR